MSNRIKLVIIKIIRNMARAISSKIFYANVNYFKNELIKC